MTSEHNKVFKKFDKPPDGKAHKYLSKKKYQSNIMLTCPLKAKGGESFLYKNETKDNKIQICDLYTWIRSESLISGNIVKIRYYLRKPGETKAKDGRFCRIVYYDTKVEPKNRVYLIYYYGDESVYVQKKEPGKTTTRTQPKIIEEIKERSKEKPQILYSDLLAKSNKKLINDNLISSELHRDTYSPRNLKQIRDIQHNERKKEKISKDFIYNAYELGLVLDDFIIKFELLPELLIIFGK